MSSGQVSSPAKTLLDFLNLDDLQRILDARKEKAKKHEALDVAEILTLVNRPVEELEKDYQVDKNEETALLRSVEKSTGVYAFETFSASNLSGDKLSHVIFVAQDLYEQIKDTWEEIESEEEREKFVEDINANKSSFAVQKLWLQNFFDLSKVDSRFSNQIIPFNLHSSEQFWWVMGSSDDVKFVRLLLRILSGQNFILSQGQAFYFPEFIQILEAFEASERTWILFLHNLIHATSQLPLQVQCYLGVFLYLMVDKMPDDPHVHWFRLHASRVLCQQDSSPGFLYLFLKKQHALISSVAESKFFLPVENHPISIKHYCFPWTSMFNEHMLIGGSAFLHAMMCFQGETEFSEQVALQWAEVLPSSDINVFFSPSTLAIHGPNEHLIIWHQAKKMVDKLKGLFAAYSPTFLCAVSLYSITLVPFLVLPGSSHPTRFRAITFHASISPCMGWDVALQSGAVFHEGVMFLERQYTDEMIKRQTGTRELRKQKLDTKMNLVQQIKNLNSQKDRILLNLGNSSLEDIPVQFGSFTGQTLSPEQQHQIHQIEDQIKELRNEMKTLNRNAKQREADIQAKAVTFYIKTLGSASYRECIEQRILNAQGMDKRTLQRLLPVYRNRVTNTEGIAIQAKPCRSPAVCFHNEIPEWKDYKKLIINGHEWESDALVGGPSTARGRMVKYGNIAHQAFHLNRVDDWRTGIEKNY